MYRKAVYVCVVVCSFYIGQNSEKTSQLGSPQAPAGEVPLRSLAPQSKGRRVFVSNTAHALSVNALFGHVL